MSSTASKTGTKTVHKKKKKVDHLNRTFWICLILVLVPIAVFGWLLFTSWLESDSPVLGDRYKDDLNPAITKAQITEITDSVSNLDGVEDASAEMATATLRVYAKIADDGTSDQAMSVAQEVYTAVTAVLDPTVYFSQHDDMKMYDLEVHVYNLDSNRDSDAFVYVIGTKTSSMEEPSYQLVSEPVNAELAEQLRSQGSVSESTATTEASASATAEG